MRGAAQPLLVRTVYPSRRAGSPVQAIYNCKGVVVLTGVGKSGFIAQKISMTLVSTGQRSIFLSPVDALHGDIGVLGPEDILVLFRSARSPARLPLFALFHGPSTLRCTANAFIIHGEQRGVPPPPPPPCSSSAQHLRGFDERIRHHGCSH